MSHTVDERTLQRCVDGELNEAEQQALLRQLDRSPAGWREVALAFIEQQLWSQAGQAWVREPVQPQVAPQAVDAPVRSSGSGLRNTALVASTLLAVGLGYLGGSRNFWSKPSQSGSDVAAAPAPQNPDPFPGGMTASVAQVNRGPTTPVAQIDPRPESDIIPESIPLTDAELLEQYGVRLMPRLSVEQRQHLLDQGYQIPEGQLPPGGFNLTSPVPMPPMISPPAATQQMEALTDAIRTLSEQVERLQGAVDKLEKQQGYEEPDDKQ